MKRHDVAPYICDIGLCAWLVLFCWIDTVSQPAPPAQAVDTVGANKGAVKENSVAAVCGDSASGEMIRAEAERAKAGRTDSSNPARDSCVNVNAADSAALLSLPGIGPVLASRILAYRREGNVFSRPEDMIGIKGIGPVKLEKIRQEICF